jgi:hypothetical protein
MEGRDARPSAADTRRGPRAAPRRVAAQATPARLLSETRLAARFLRGLPRFLRRPLTPGQAETILRRRLARRDADFLELVRRSVYEHPPSPYRALLEWAGCQYADLERLVAREGVEGALSALLRAGVYLSVDELKGRQPVVRGAHVLAVEPGQLGNPRASLHVSAWSSGSRGAGTPILNGLDSIRDRAVNTCLTLDARGGLDWEKGVWAVPGSLTLMLRYAAFGAPPTGWFSCVDPDTPGLHPRYRWSERALRWGAALAGVRIPLQHHAPPHDPQPVVRWMRAVLDRGRVPHLWAFPSAAVRAVQAAAAAGVDIRGARLTVTGEPVTAARLAAIRAAGVDAVPDYGSAESGGVAAYGCLSPEAPDDVHVYQDLHAVVQPGAGSPHALPPRAVCLSSLRLTSPLVLLNVSMGDQAILGARACGCPLERLGWRTHLHAIRSFEKLTAGGVTFLDADVVRVLEETLPARFGGGPLDYQLVEEEEALDGRPGLRLLVHPRLGALPERVIADAFLDAITAGSGAARVAGSLWREMGLPRVERRLPLTTAGGKILHVHAAASARPAPATPATAATAATAGG